MGDIGDFTPAVDEWDWVESWLDVWVMDMRDPELRLEAPGKAAGFAPGGWGGYREVADEWQASANARAVGIINASLIDMSPAESCAVMHVKLFAVFRFRKPVEELYLSARMKIGIRLRANDFT